VTARSPINEFGPVLGSTQPSAGVGTSVTPGNNTYGSYVSLLTAIADKAYAVRLNIVNNTVSAQARDSLLKLGIDFAGGSAFQDIILDLAASSAGVQSGTTGGGGGIEYYIPLEIPAGASIGVAGSVNNATVGTMSCYARLRRQPTGPVIPRAGAFVRTFGSTPASSSGTAITVGTPAKGAWVQIGGAVTEPLWYWNLGCCINQAVVVNNNPIAFDMALGPNTSNLRMVIADQLALPSTSESWSFRSEGEYAVAAPGDLIWVRAQILSTVITGISAIVYGTGG
jgi:hypothetical protein